MVPYANSSPCLTRLGVRSYDYVISIHLLYDYVIFGIMEDVLDVTFQRSVRGSPFRARDLAVLDANVIENYGHMWVFLSGRR